MPILLTESCKRLSAGWGQSRLALPALMRFCRPHHLLAIVERRTNICVLGLCNLLLSQHLLRGTFRLKFLVYAFVSVK